MKINRNKLKDPYQSRSVIFFLITLFTFLSIFNATSKRAYADPWKDMGALRVPETPPIDFTLQSLNGESVTLSDLKGKIILINFWASWCHACVVEMPSIERLYRKYKDKGFTVLAIDIMEKLQTVKKFAKKKDLTFPILLDTKGKIKVKYRVSGIPTSYLINRGGMTVGKIVGAREWDSKQAMAVIEELLGE